jgi:acyl-coenzyme A thioesterase PaaI-like protein
MKSCFIFSATFLSFHRGWYHCNQNNEKSFLSKSSSRLHAFNEENYQSRQKNLVEYRPNPVLYERIDDRIFRSDPSNLYDPSKPDSPLHSHVLYSSLLGESRVECYEIYKPISLSSSPSVSFPTVTDEHEIYCIIGFGDRINGWPNIVHGGITALLFDNTFGWLLAACNLPKAVTASLTVNYRNIIRPNSVSILKAKVAKIEGEKKLIMTATIEDAESKKIQADASTLFIIMGGGAKKEKENEQDKAKDDNMNGKKRSQ